MSLRVLWFVVAGFILGFATSTLWEWLYYRGKRKAQFLQTAPPIFQAAPPTSSRAGTESSIEQPQETWALSYRSPGIYLENEQPQVQLSETTGMTDEPSSHVFVEPMGEMDVPDTPIAATATFTEPRINPTTLAVLQSTVAKTPIAQPSLRESDPVTVSSVSVPTTPIAHPFVQPEKLAKTIITGKEEAEAEVVEANVAVSTPSSTISIKQSREQALQPAIVELRLPEPQGAIQPARALSTKAIALTDHPDDLALIKGVGEAYKRRLYNAGVYTWRQVAESDVETLRRITRVKPNANIGGWRQQAQELAEKYQRWDTTFQGPLDDFTRIDGIGAITADILYKAGLCTYEQLTDTSPDELAKIVPAPTVGNEIDFAGWINAAMRLANTKRRNQELLP